MYLTIEGGKKISMPRYYKDKLYTDEQREQIAEAYKKVLDEKNQENFKLWREDPTAYYKQQQAAIQQAFKRMDLKAAVDKL